MTAVHPEASRQAALVLLERMGLSPADLTTAPQPRTPAPAFAGYVPVVAAAVSAGTWRAYGSSWNRVLEHWGSRRLDELAPSEIRQLMAYVKTRVVARRNTRGGRRHRQAMRPMRPPAQQAAPVVRGCPGQLPERKRSQAGGRARGPRRTLRPGCRRCTGPARRTAR